MNTSKFDIVKVRKEKKTLLETVKPGMRFRVIESIDPETDHLIDKIGVVEHVGGRPPIGLAFPGERASDWNMGLWWFELKEIMRVG